MTVPGFAEARAQPNLFEACFTQTGTLYLINQPGLDGDCKNANHTPISWTGALGADHGLLTGLADDDHGQYLLAEGVRNSRDGFAVTGPLLSGSIPVEGPGTRLMWYPARGALRAGQVTDDRWDAANIGLRSVAFGFNSRASGGEAVAIGRGATATGLESTAVGPSTQATGLRSTALGNGTLASGRNSTAMGDNTSVR